MSSRSIYRKLHKNMCKGCDYASKQSFEEAELNFNSKNHNNKRECIKCRKNATKGRSNERSFRRKF